MATSPMSQQTAASLRSLLSGLIDYAGLFPPAGLDMAPAVANYAKYATREYSFALGHFIVPVTRLGEFQVAQASVNITTPWKVSALGSGDVKADALTIREFNQRSSRRAIVDTIEVKANTVEAIDRIRASVPEGMTAYFEVPLDASLDLVSHIRYVGARAKIRTGGVAAEAIPPTTVVARFITNCAAAGTAFKATAGLHHPVRCVKPLTYEPGAPSGKMHGFLNVFLAALFGREGARSEIIARVLDEEHSETFSFDDTQACWRAGFGRNQTAESAGAGISSERIRAAREQFAISFGSCSFEEPIEDLRALQLL